MRVEPIDVAGDPPVRGVLHAGAAPAADGLVLTHGAGGNKDAPLLVAVAEAFAARGVTVLRCDLPYRQARPRGAPSPAGAARDREGLRAALTVLRTRVSGRLFLGGHSYGGRQASMLLAAEPTLASGLLLQSYPLHPPGRAGRPSHRAPAPASGPDALRPRGHRRLRHPRRARVCARADPRPHARAVDQRRSRSGMGQEAQRPRPARDHRRHVPRPDANERLGAARL